MEAFNEEMSAKMTVLTEENDKLKRENEELRRHASRASSDRHDLISMLDNVESEVEGLRKKNSQLEARQAENLNRIHRQTENLNNLQNLHKLNRENQSKLEKELIEEGKKNKELKFRIWVQLDRAKWYVHRSWWPTL